jgi:phosphoribosylamine--glycine ligase
VAGVADQLRHAGVAVFGPSAAAARIEGSKSFAKDVMVAGRWVPTAERLARGNSRPASSRSTGSPPDKGVFVCRTQAELDEGLRAAGSRGETLMIEELLEGEEVSVFAVCDGQEAQALAPARTSNASATETSARTRVGWAPIRRCRASARQRSTSSCATVHRPVLTELARRGSPFVGLLYAG